MGVWGCVCVCGGGGGGGEEIEGFVFLPRAFKARFWLEPLN